MRKKVVVPKEHPLAWQSKLWPHEDLIRSMRRSRKTWKAIAEHLLVQHQISISHQAVRNFLDRASNPKPKRQKTLKGFNPPSPVESSAATEPRDNQSIVQKMKARATEKQETKPDNRSTWEPLNPEELSK